MAHASPLDNLIELARDQRDDALSRLAAAVSASRSLEERYALLINYRAEYAAHFAASARSGLPLGQLLQFRLFLDKLEGAIAQQQQAMRSQDAQQLEQRTDWAKRESRLQGYSTLRERRRAARSVQARRHEQQSTDEHSRLAEARATKET
jgi:flagellar FliJ protein